MIGAPGRVTAFRRRPRRREDAPRDADLRIVDVAPISLRGDSWNACLSRFAKQLYNFLNFPRLVQAFQEFIEK